MPSLDTVESESKPGRRIKVFIDYWNFQLDVRDANPSFRIDWLRLPYWLAEMGAEVVGLPDFSYEGAHVFASYDPKRASDDKFTHWLTSWLDRQSGIQVIAKKRVFRPPPRCRNCKNRIQDCPVCETDMSGTIEKGVDAAIVTAMIRLAWEDAYDIAVIASSDSDLVPGVEFLDLRGKKIVQAGFPPSGSALATASWGSFNVVARMAQFERR